MRALPAAVAGLIVGALPYGVFAFGEDLVGAGWMLDAWLEWGQETAVFAVLGAVGALGFLAVYRAVLGQDRVAGAVTQLRSYLLKFSIGKRLLKRKLEL